MCDIQGYPGMDAYKGKKLNGHKLCGDFTGADFTNSQLVKVTLHNADFVGAHFCGASLTIDRIEGAYSFAGAHFDGADLTGLSCELARAIIASATSYANVRLPHGC